MKIQNLTKHLKQLLITTYKVVPIGGLHYLLEDHTLVWFVTLNFWFEFETANQPGFKPRSLGPKAATLTIELHYIYKDLQCLHAFSLICYRPFTLPSFLQIFFFTISIKQELKKFEIHNWQNKQKIQKKLKRFCWPKVQRTYAGIVWSQILF